MTSNLRRSLVRAGIALAVVAAFAGTGATGALAQDSLGSVVTIGGGSAGVGGGDVQVIAPGVTISGGTVVNGTSIGVDSAGGSSIGGATGGNESAAVVE
jgi:hypothetical protein